MLKEIGTAALSALISIAALFVLTRLIGKRQVSQLSLFDYVNGITIGSIAAELAVAQGRERIVPLVAMTVYALISLAIALITCKSIALRRFFTGKPTILYENGTIYEKNLIKARLDVNEFLTHLRTQGYFDLSEIECAVLEINGSVSVLPKSPYRPTTPEDMGLSPQRAAPAVNVIIDGSVMAENLRHTGNNRQWLDNELEKQGAKLSEVILATVDGENLLSVYLKTNEQYKKDYYI